MSQIPCEDTLECRQCGTVLVPIDCAHVPIPRCPRCLAVYLPNGLCESLVDGTDEHLEGLAQNLFLVEEVETDELSQESGTLASCPECGRLMDGFLERVPEAQRCFAHGVWLTRLALRSAYALGCSKTEFAEVADVPDSTFESEAFDALMAQETASPISVNEDMPVREKGVRALSVLLDLIARCR